MKDYRETLEPHEQRRYDAQMDAEIHYKRLERPDRPRPPNGYAKTVLCCHRANAQGIQVVQGAA